MSVTDCKRLLVPRLWQSGHQKLIKDKLISLGKNLETRYINAKSIRDQRIDLTINQHIRSFVWGYFFCTYVSDCFFYAVWNTHVPLLWPVGTGLCFNKILARFRPRFRHWFRITCGSHFTLYRRANPVSLPFFERFSPRCECFNKSSVLSGHWCCRLHVLVYPFMPGCIFISRTALLWDNMGIIWKYIFHNRLWCASVV